MLTYYVIYRDEERVNPSGTFVVDVSNGRAFLWDHRKKAWSYNPDLVFRFLDDYRNYDRYVEVERSVAERVALIVSDGSSLPDDAGFNRIYLDTDESRSLSQPSCSPPTKKGSE
ncbi:hypothetical protein [Micromonospora sp. KC213]|uniref:hypothetical protein n=1 Tax=Micromonospora sp. KC213 TaxID=2530378 RepID=UPI00104AFF47|nr:hypothetical protein [Micromonospora sp. KC213]TDC31393.1 hypothetical protein E1166_27945 [Micromonospora sp. KC213]